MSNFHNLPDSVENTDLKKCFVDFLIYYCNNTNTLNVYYALNELLELSDRQWHTYELLDREVAEQIEKYLKSIIDFKDEEIMDYILSIIPKIGMRELFEYILKNRIKIDNKNILDNISKAEDEYGNDVDNPYSGM